MSIDFLQAKDIFMAAVEKADGTLRIAFLDEVCGNDVGLRHHVDLLLSAHEHSGSFLDKGAVASPALDLLPTEMPGTVIGPYKLLEQIGEGGFGVVFMAEQERPVRRRVAIKVIKPGMDTRQVIARFEAERQALAMMDHPNIAKVFDAGSTETGRPYFVMELVQGVPITEYCDKCNLTTSERLELFVLVCQAVQHAHQKGVIHRDIKPTNVLVAMQDGGPAPKIIDFGVAKAITQQLTERTLMTAFAQIVGTPLYMSPEQAELRPLGVDTRSDIYSLGVLLYELLTGATPFDKDRLHAASYDELRRIIREEEPPRPSARISTLAADLATTVAEHRRTESRRLQQTVRGDLDWIVMKCLDKDRNRRYDSAGSLARDIERYLYDEPVLACPPSIFYRLKKFVRRNKIAATFVVFVLAGLTVLTVSNIQTRQNERRAVTESAKAIATSNLLLAMLDSASPEQAKGSAYTVRELLDDFSAGLGDQLKDQPDAEAAVRATIGNAYRRLDLFRKAQPHLETALKLRRDIFGDDHEKVAESMVDLAWNYHGQQDNKRAEPLLRDALKIYDRHAADPQQVVRALWRLECVLNAGKRFDESDAIAQRALDVAATKPRTEYPEVASVLHSLAQVRINQKRFPEAAQLAAQSVELHRRVRAANHPETAFALQKLGVALREQGKYAEARAALQEALDIFRKNYGFENSAFTKCLGDLKSVLKTLGDKPASDALIQEEVEHAARFSTPENHVRLASLLLKNKPTEDQKQEARRLIRWAIEGYEKVALEAPDDLERRVAALAGFARAAGACAGSRDFEAEVGELNRRLEVELPKLAAAFPNSSDCQWRSAMVYREWALQLIPYGSYLPSAESALRKSIEVLRKISLVDPKRSGLWLNLGDTYICLGDVQWRISRRDDASSAFQRAMEIYDHHTAEIAADATPPDTFTFSLGYIRLSEYLICIGRGDEAAESVRKAVSAAKSLKDLGYFSDALFGEAMGRLRLGDEVGYRKVCESLPPLTDDNSNEQVRLRRIWIWCFGPHPGEDLSAPIRQAEEFAKKNSLNAPYDDLLILGALYFRAGQYERATKSLTDSIAAFPGDPPFGYGDVIFPEVFLAMTLWHQDQRDKARHLLSETKVATKKWVTSPSCPWYGRAQIESLCREAEELIKPKEASEAVEMKAAPVTTNTSNDDPTSVPTHNPQP